MDEKKYGVLDLFAGCGGLSLGFQMAGFQIRGGIDFKEDAIKTYAFNFKNTTNYSKDIKEISEKEILQHYGEIDIIVGGPPCQGFSSANMWQKDQNQDDRNLLFFEFIRFVKLLRPKIILLENVKEILTKGKGEIKRKIEEELSNLGYEVTNKILLASDHGVPQKRRRNFFIGITKSLKNKFDFDKLKKSETISVEEAISDLYDLEKIEGELILNKPKSKYQKLMRKKSKDEVHNHALRYPNEKVIQRMKYVKEGENWSAVPEQLWDRKRDNRHSSAYKRLDSKDVSITIDTGHMNYFHPKFNRVPTVRESARLQSFPDNFIFIGSQTSQLKQVGNAVPPLLAMEIAKLIKKMLVENSL